MSDFLDLVAQAIKPTMTRVDREAVYDVVREAVRRLRDREGFEAADARLAVQQHIVEETIRDIEAEVARVEAMRKLDAALAAQTEAHNRR